MTVKQRGPGTSVPGPPSGVVGSRERAREMLRLRTEQGLTLAAIGARFGVGRERVRQIINRHLYKTTGKPPDPGALSRHAAQTRRAATVARAQAHTADLLAGWRNGAKAQQLAEVYGLPKRCVQDVLREHANTEESATRSVTVGDPDVREING